VVPHAIRRVALATAAAIAAVAVMVADRATGVQVGAALVLAAALMLLAHAALRVAEDPTSGRRERGPGAGLR
jgi:hypothetical protein